MGNETFYGDGLSYFLVPHKKALVQDRVFIYFIENELNVQNKTWRRDHSFEGIMHWHRHNRREPLFL